MKKLLIAVVILLTGCTEDCELISSAGQLEMYYCSNVESVPGEMYKIVYNEYYYNLHYNSNIIIEYKEEHYSTVDELMDLITLVDPSELFDVGYRMERIVIGEMYWDKNY